MLQSKINLIERLLGNSKESKDLKDKFFQMILTPQEGYQTKKHWHARPYLRQLMAPEPFYADQAKRCPVLHEKATDVENVLLNRKQSTVAPLLLEASKKSSPDVHLQNEQLIQIVN